MSSLNSAIKILESRSTMLVRPSTSYVNRLVQRTLTRAFQTSSIKRNSTTAAPAESNVLANVLAKAIEVHMH